MSPDSADDLQQIASAFADPGAARAAAERDLGALGRVCRVLDIGCGPGTFLDAARSLGIEAVGIDASASATEQARRLGHQVERGDALEVVRALTERGDRFDGAALSHVIEHLLPARALELLRAVHAVLRPNGRLLIRTPNAKNALVLSEFFWLDPTHVRPYPRALLSELGRAVGFDTVASFDDAASAFARPPLRKLIQRLRSALSGVDRVGALDVVVVLSRS